MERRFKAEPLLKQISSQSALGGNILRFFGTDTTAASKVFCFFLNNMGVSGPGRDKFNEGAQIQSD